MGTLLKKETHENTGDEGGAVLRRVVEHGVEAGRDLVHHLPRLAVRLHVLDLREDGLEQRPKQESSYVLVSLGEEQP